MQTPTTPLPSPSRAAPLALVLGAVPPIALLAAACGGDDTAAQRQLQPDRRIGISPKATAPGRPLVRQARRQLPHRPDTGRDHVHLYYDGNRAAGQYGIAYAKTFTVTGLTPAARSRPSWPTPTTAPPTPTASRSP